jgi:serine/threonine-protein kinase
MADPDDDATPVFGKRPAEAAPERPSAGELEVGSRVGDYIVESRRGGGGFATVYRARDERTNRVIALKVLHSYLARSASVLKRFHREAETIARLDHPNIVRLLGSGDTGGVPYLVMEWIDGATIAETLDARGPYSLDEILPIIEALTKALAAAHAVGIVHRDLKVANVALSDRGEVKLLDFGVAKLLAPDGADFGFTTAGTTLGTPHYMAPEQVLGDAIDHRVDVYALGILVFEMLTARRPFDGKNHLEVEAQQIEEPAPAASRFAAVPAGVDAVIRRAMEKRPEARQADVLELYAQLAAAVSGRAAPVVARRQAVALYVHSGVRTEDVGDDVLDQLDRALDRVRADAGSAGLEIATDAGGSLLFVGVPPAGTTVENLVDRVEALAREASAGIAHPDILLSMTVHLAEVDLPAGRRAWSGPLLDLPTWTRTERSGVFVTPAAMKRT